MVCRGVETRVHVAELRKQISAQVLITIDFMESRMEMNKQLCRYLPSTSRMTT